jgi:dTDP-4-dehydrorhamnose 3,5-epimerase
VVVERVDTALDGVFILEPRVFEDGRGFFLESYNQRVFADLGIDHRFVQDNHSLSRRGVLRGLHYQIRQPQAKLVRVTSGRVWDVIVDIRRGSPGFSRWLGVTLSSDNRRMVFAPEGFAHGFLVLSEEAEFQYKCSDFWAPEHERGVAWNDPDIGIDWPLEGVQPELSAKDRVAPLLANVAEDDLPIYR